MAVKVQQYAENGVLISKSPVYVGDEITITYTGLLAKSGADMIYIHIGYGNSWDNKDYVQMEFDGEAFKASFKVLMPGTMNLAFKDSAENWDNNSSSDYSFKVSKKAVRAVKAPEEKAAEKTAEKKSSTKSKTAAGKKTPASKPAAAKKAVKKTAKES